MGSNSSLEGRVELCLDGMWGTICDNFWGNAEATVVCNQLSLGSTDAVGVSGARFGPGTGPILLDSFFCRGTEVVLTNCFHRPPDNTACTHGQDASVICSGTSWIYTSSFFYLLSYFVCRTQVQEWRCETGRRTVSIRGQG